MRVSPSIALALAALTITACDNVKFPGAGPRPSDVEQETPPPPITPVETPATETSTPADETPAPSPTVDPVTPDAPAEPDAPEGEDTSTPDETAATTDNPLPETNLYIDVDNLLSIMQKDARQPVTRYLKRLHR